MAYGRKSKVVSIGVFVLLLIAIFIYWQVTILGHTLRTMPTDQAEKVGLAAFSDIVLDPSVFAEAHPGRKDASIPLLAEYGNDRDRLVRRSMLVRTWLNAGLLAKDLSKLPMREGQIVSSKDLAQVSPEHRVDGWRNPYCVFAGNAEVAVMSSGGNGSLDCDSLSQTGAETLARASTKRLTQTSTGILVTVQPIVKSVNQ